MKRLTWLSLALACLACGELEIPVTKASRLPAAEGGIGASSAGGADAGGGFAGESDDPGGTSDGRDRGRVQVRDGELLTDKGTRLRGVSVGRDGGSAGDPLDAELVSALSAENGLNALHVYLENSGDIAGSHAEEGDALVEMTSTAGMYLIVGMGGGKAHGTFDLEAVRSFWSFYAPRYAARTHVLYEILNIPDWSCDVAYPEETLAMEVDVHDLIRSYAPSTHVALLSLAALPTQNAIEANIDRLAGSVDWSKASIAFHTALCDDAGALTDITAATRARGIATFASEMLYRTSFESTAQLESERIGWLSFEWLVRTRDMLAFRDAHTEASISWCPDFGRWPQDSETCSTP